MVSTLPVEQKYAFEARRMTLSASQKLVSVISYLGGPNITSGDIDWAIDLPAGKRLIEWLADQVDDEQVSNAGDSGVERRYYVALKSVALEQEESSS